MAGLNMIFALFPNPITDPVAIFLVIMAVLLIAPLLFERLRLPGIVGLIIAGVIIGPYGLGILERDSTIILFGTVGLLFLMFLAGLETSLNDLKYNAKKAVVFGLATFIVPMSLGTLAMLGLGYSILASILVASCFASHTLLSLPIVTKQGIMRTQVITTTLGGTLIVNTLALLVLAVVVKADQGNLTLSFWLFLIPALAAYTFITLWGVPIVGRWFFRTFGHDEGAEFTFVVATLFIVSYGAKLIEIEPIIGAFLAGIGIRPLIPQLSPLMNRIQFIGNTLFVPLFLISVGMLVNPSTLIQEPRSLLVSGVMVIVAIVAKFIPAWGTGKLFQFSKPAIMVMFGLSVAQAASTLAAITVAYKIELVDQLTVNGTIAMILVTCILSPWVTDRWGNQVKTTPKNQSSSSDITDPEAHQLIESYRVLVPVANPNTEDNLLKLALLLVNATQGTLFPLHILTDRNGRITADAKTQQDQLLATAEMVAHATSTKVKTIARIDSSIDQGILHVAQERDVNLIICGWKGYSTYKDNFFGSVIDNVVKKSFVPVLITRFKHPIKTTQRVILAVSDNQYTFYNFEPSVKLTQALASQLKASFEIFHVVSNNTSSDLIKQQYPDLPVKQVQGQFIKKVLKRWKTDDLLVLITRGDRNLIGFPALGAAPEAIAGNYRNISMIVVCYKN
jgi:Kef-type K+ transport system membrane component KefB